MTKSLYSVKEVAGRKGLMSIGEDWQSLTERISSPHYFHYHQYYQSFVDAFLSDGSDLHYFLIYEDEILRAIFPMRKRTFTCFGFSIASFEVPLNSTSSLSDIISDTGEVRIIDALFDYLDSKNEACHIIKIPSNLEDSHLGQILTDLNSHRSICIVDDLNDYLDKELLDLAGSRFQKKSRSVYRKLKKLKELGGLEFLIVSDREELRAAYQEFKEVEGSGWKGRAGFAVKETPEDDRYLMSLIDTFAAINCCRIYLLKLKNQTIAAEFCILTKTTCYFKKIGYNETYSKLSPGVILMEFVFHHLSVENRFEEFNFITHFNFYQLWSPKSRRVYDRYLFNYTVKGKMARFWYSCKKIINKIKSESN